MWFLPCDQECSGNELIFAVPKENGQDEARFYSLDIRKFCCGVNEVIDICPDCAREEYPIMVDVNGLPVDKESSASE